MLEVFKVGLGLKTGFAQSSGKREECFCKILVKQLILNALIAVVDASTLKSRCSGSCRSFAATLLLTSVISDAAAVARIAKKAFTKAKCTSLQLVVGGS